jgi:hypothetical protein
LTVFLAGAKAMREAVAQWLACGCPADQQARVMAAALTGGHNCAARWNACGRTDCLALLAAEVLELPLPDTNPGGGRP